MTTRSLSNQSYQGNGIPWCPFFDKEKEYETQKVCLCFLIFIEMVKSFTRRILSVMDKYQALVKYRPLQAFSWIWSFYMSCCLS